MILRRLVSFRFLLGGLLTLGILALVAVPAPSREDEVSRTQQIADLEKQIADLNKKLATLRNGNGTGQTAGQQTLPADWTKALTWRCIGPAAMGGRITDLAVVPGRDDP